MANRLWILVKGELNRLNKYNMTSISILVAIIWGVILFFINLEALEYLLPLVLMMDATMMAIMYVGSVMFRISFRVATVFSFRSSLTCSSSI